MFTIFFSCESNKDTNYFRNFNTYVQSALNIRSFTKNYAPLLNLLGQKQIILFLENSTICDAIREKRPSRQKWNGEILHDERLKKSRAQGNGAENSKWGILTPTSYSFPAFPHSLFSYSSSGFNFSTTVRAGRPLMYWVSP